VPLDRHAALVINKPSFWPRPEVEQAFRILMENQTPACAVIDSSVRMPTEAAKQPPGLSCWTRKPVANRCNGAERTFWNAKQAASATFEDAGRAGSL